MSLMLGAPGAPPRRRRAARGYALVVVMLMVVLASLAATVATSHAKVVVQREREADLLFVGDEYRRALQSYHTLVPAGGVPQFPATLAELLVDKRFPNPVRHLRKLYVDPMTGKADWALETLQGRIVGLHSTSAADPLRKAGFPAVDAAFADANSYVQWRFLASDTAGTVGAGTAAGPGAGAGTGAAVGAGAGTGAGGGTGDRAGAGSGAGPAAGAAATRASPGDTSDGAPAAQPDDAAPRRPKADAGESNVAQALLAHGADPNRMDRAGRSPLFVALFENHSAIADLLIRDRRTNLALASEGYPPRFWAAQLGHDMLAGMIDARLH